MQWTCMLDDEVKVRVQNSHVKRRSPVWTADMWRVKLAVCEKLHRHIDTQRSHDTDTSAKLSHSVDMANLFIPQCSVTVLITVYLPNHKISLINLFIPLLLLLL